MWTSHRIFDSTHIIRGLQRFPKPGLAPNYGSLMQSQQRSQRNRLGLDSAALVKIEPPPYHAAGILIYAAEVQFNRKRRK